MSKGVHTEFIQRAQRLMVRPPGLPNPQPTVSQWQLPPHPSVASAQSAVLASDTDVAIIGSGVSGCAVAHTLLHDAGAQTSGLRVTVLEARNAVSGATGRNGGHLMCDTDASFDSLVAVLGAELATTILRFSEANIARLRALAAEEGVEDVAELRSVVAVLGLGDVESLAHYRECAQLVRDTVPERSLRMEEISAEEAAEKYHLKNVVGGVEQYGAAALWPYRLFTAVFASLLRIFAGRFALETNTPVQSIVYDPGHVRPYVLATPRGTIRAKQVIHCTNGFAAHLAPQLATGSLWPLRGTMSVQRPAVAFPRMGGQISWSHTGTGWCDVGAGVLNVNLYYAQQNEKTGEIWIGGEVQKLEELLTSDDSSVGDVAAENLLSVLPELLDGVAPNDDDDDDNNRASTRLWSGIMGFTADGMPLVCRLTPQMTGRDGEGEWISAGFNGHGMDKCWLSGEAVARMALGQGVAAWFPRAYLTDDERLARLQGNGGAAAFLEHYPVR